MIDIDTKTQIQRNIRSFVLRQGRLTKGQQQALDKSWPHFGIADNHDVLDLVTLFNRQAPTTLEIGFGNGDSLAQMALAAPERNFIGIEVHTPGVGHLLHLIEEHNISNIRIVNSDAVTFIRERLTNDSLDGVQIYFPDPWHKKRHNKRRIVQPDFISLLAQRMQPQALLHLATDWEDYALHMAAVMDNHTQFDRTTPDSAFSPRPEFRPLTKFEQRGLRLGHGVWDLLYYKTTD